MEQMIIYYKQTLIKMNIFKIAGKYLDQPLLVAKFQKRVPLLLTTGGAGYVAYSVKKNDNNQVPNNNNKKEINITTLCRECGIARATLTDFKKGRIKSLSMSVMSLIASYFGVSVEYLYSGSAPVIDDAAVKVALFGGDTTVTDEMWKEIKRYVEKAETLKSKALALSC